ncbi:helix-turn-helix domain-containing protein [Chryseobacterium oncorhynchi]|uniref:XRE family transcriptional regulator n=1 Tax=Chryseobacterium oncorhynchi TaxID=741074 RepID=A0A316WEW3_9FLAO|nr:helix-turn-helix transcriptional regulator [Chryseobacterium oncorhynchi]PWN59952.1 XRE family transcriptional regulator [Chryseobacterium oncorhynchi]
MKSIEDNLDILDKRKVVAGIIKKKREEMKISQSKLAAAVGLSKSSIYRIENAAFSPNADQLYLILTFLNIKFSLDDKEL